MPNSRVTSFFSYFFLALLCFQPASDAKENQTFDLQVDNLHAELGGTQTAGTGSGSKAKNILSQVRFGFKGKYIYKVTDQFNVGAFGGVRLYDYSKELSTKIANDQRTMSVRGGLIAEYFTFPWWSLEDQVYYDQQLYYYGSLPIPPGNLVFNVDSIFRNDFMTHFRVVDESWIGLWLGGGFIYMDWGKHIDSGKGFIVDGSISIIRDSGLSIRGAFSRLNFDFVTASEYLELLELGLDYKLEF